MKTIHLRRFVGLGLLLLCPAERLRASDESAPPALPDTTATLAAADAMAKANLPSSDQHVFVPIDPTWHAMISYQKLRPDAFVTVDHPTQHEKRTLYMEVRYLPPGKSDANDAAKIVTYYPNGSIYREIDNSWMNQFCRTFFRDGLLRNYTHWSWAHWVGGLAVNPETKKANYFSGGSGSLTTYEQTPGNYQVEWHQNGAVFMVEEFVASNRTKITLWVGYDALRVTSENEELSLTSEREEWNRHPGSDPSFQLIYDSRGGSVVPKNSDVKTVPPMMGTRPSQEEELKKIYEGWKIAYPKRRNAFLEQFAQILARSGQTWKSLDIEFICDGTPWPK